MMLSLVESIDFSTKWNLDRNTIYSRNFRRNSKGIPQPLSLNHLGLVNLQSKNTLKFVLYAKQGIEKSVYL